MKDYNITLCIQAEVKIAATDDVSAVKRAQELAIGKLEELEELTSVSVEETFEILC